MKTFGQQALAGVILVDLDGTLAYFDQWHGPAHIGHPIGPMYRRVAAWLAAGQEVRLFTARLAHDVDGQGKAAIEAWCLEHFARILPVTAEKDYLAVAIYDDRAVQVEANTGRLVGEPDMAAIEEVAWRLTQGYRYQPGYDRADAVEVIATLFRRPA